MNKSCSCSKCVRLCQRNPGWMTPEEAEKAISFGYGKRLMRDWLEPESKVGNKERIYVLAAASIGYEGNDAPEGDWMAMLCGHWSKGRCTFLINKLCEIHDSGFKPRQCRESFGCSKEETGPDNYEMARLWDSDKGRSVVSSWMALTNKT